MPLQPTTKGTKPRSQPPQGPPPPSALAAAAGATEPRAQAPYRPARLRSNAIGYAGLRRFPRSDTYQPGRLPRAATRPSARSVALAEYGSTHAHAEGVPHDTSISIHSCAFPTLRNPCGSSFLCTAVHYITLALRFNNLERYIGNSIRRGSAESKMNSYRL
jgi:hypothetical protein